MNVAPLRIITKARYAVSAGIPIRVEIKKCGFLTNEIDDAALLGKLLIARPKFRRALCYQAAEMEHCSHVSHGLVGDEVGKSIRKRQWTQGECTPARIAKRNDDISRVEGCEGAH